MSNTHINRRRFLKAGALGTLGLAAGAAALGQGGRAVAQEGDNPEVHAGHSGIAMPGFVGEVDHAGNGFNPTDILVDFNWGDRVSIDSDGRTLREYDLFASDKDVEVAPGIIFPAWTYNGRIPGPTLRAREGDRLQINFVNASAHPHTIHFHGIHPGNMDGVYEVVAPGQRFTYAFDAEPFGVHLYHCHVMPLAKHIAKGLYGAFIIDPAGGWPPAERELVMVMAGNDIDFDGGNDFYNVNFIPFHYDRHPIQVKTGELVRVFLVNVLEYDLLNSFHLHANLFHWYPTGTSLTASEFTDTLILGQAQRGMLEFRYKYPGKYMFHAHVTEFAELGWTGVIEVTD
ncbi:MAG: multicopper oxidase domain-containing protein [Anaerolineales bacterium]|nr:multicopper oxidase domain-containing protein [Anaerolineales bacterium]